MTASSNAPGPDPFRQAAPVLIHRWTQIWTTIKPTLRFLMETEVHVYSFSIAANILLSFFPFLLTIILIFRSVFHWEAGVQAVLLAVNDSFPDSSHHNYVDIGRSLQDVAGIHHGISLVSLLLLFFTANGIFEPLEVALNRAWKVTKNRSFLQNQIVSMGLIFVCGVLVLLSAVLTAWNRQILATAFGDGLAAEFAGTLGFKLVLLPISMVMIFLIYWILPNCKVPARRLIPVSVAVGILLEALKYFNILTWPWLKVKLTGEEGLFIHSVSIILWSFLGAMIVLAGAEWSARVTLEIEQPTEDVNRLG